MSSISSGLIKYPYRTTSIVVDYCSALGERMGVAAYFSSLVQERRYHPALLSEGIPAEVLEYRIDRILNSWPQKMKALSASKEGCFVDNFGIGETKAIFLQSTFQTILFNIKEWGKGKYKVVDLFRDLFTGEKSARHRFKETSPVMFRDQMKITHLLKGISGLCLPYFCSEEDLFTLSPFRALTLTQWIEQRGEITKKEFFSISFGLLETSKAVHARSIIMSDNRTTNMLVKTKDSGEFEACEITDFDFWKKDSLEGDNQFQVASNRCAIVSDILILAQYTEGDLSFIKELRAEESWDQLISKIRLLKL